MSTEQKHSETKKLTFNDLFVRPDEVGEQELVQALYKKVYLIDKSDKFFFDTNFEKTASISTRLVLVGLANHVLCQKGIINVENLAKDAEWYASLIQGGTPKTVLEYLSRLKRTKVFIKTDKGYQIPPWGIRRAIEFLKDRQPKD